MTVVVEADPPLGVEAVPLAGHREVLRAVEPQPHRPTGEPGAESRHGGEPVRLHLLAAEAAAHPQALHGDLVVVQPEHVGDDLLRLAGVLGAALHEHLPRLVEVGQRAVGLEVEVLLPGHLGLAAEDVDGAREAALDVAARHLRPAALEALGRDRLTQRDERGQRLVVGLDGGCAQPRRLQGLAEHPADRLPVEAHLVGEERLVALHAAVVDARHVGRGEHPHDARHGVRRLDAQAGDPRVRVGGLHRPGVQAVLGAEDQVVGVERGAGHVLGGALVRHLLADHGVGGAV